MAFWGMIRLVRVQETSREVKHEPFANDSKCMDLENKECLYACRTNDCSQWFSRIFVTVKMNLKALD
jgi:hypothetical protein